MKKIKRKIYNTPKKEKHKNKINNLLDFKKSFNNKRCNICESIMGNHKNRIYCGKCKISI